MLYSRLEETKPNHWAVITPAKDPKPIATLAIGQGRCHVIMHGLLNVEEASTVTEYLQILTKAAKLAQSE